MGVAEMGFSPQPCVVAAQRQAYHHPLELDEAAVIRIAVYNAGESPPVDGTIT
jgi:hypothetical protein